MKLLTVLEVKNLKSVFSKFDKDGGGSITSDEAEQVYLEWYQTYLVSICLNFNQPTNFSLGCKLRKGSLRKVNMGYYLQIIHNFFS